jgi:protein disulfide-isomerase A1
VASSKVSDIERWVKDLSIPFIAEVSGDNYATYAQCGKPLSYLFLDPTHEKKEEYINRVKSVAEKYYGKVNFVWIDAIKFGDHAKSLNLQEVHWPGFVIHDIEKQLKYPYDQSQEITAEGVGDWVAQFVDGKLVPQLKSQPVPEKQDENVYTVVGKNFDQVVYDDTKDVFLELYATWLVMVIPPLDR